MLSCTKKLDPTVLHDKSVLGPTENLSFRQFYAKRRWVYSFCKHGTTEVQSRSGRPLKTAGDERRISNCFSRNPRMSLRIASIPLGLPTSSIHWFLQKRLHLCPDWIHIVQKLEEPDYEAYIGFLIGPHWIPNCMHRFLTLLFSWLMSRSRGWKSKRTQRMDVEIIRSNKTRQLSRDSGKVTVFGVM